MSKQPRRSRREQGTAESFPDAFYDWLLVNGQLIEALRSLRRVGEEASAALDAVLAIPRIAEARLSWMLWEALVEGEGGDPELLLSRAIEPNVIARSRFAFWGNTWSECADVVVEGVA